MSTVQFFIQHLAKELWLEENEIGPGMMRKLEKIAVVHNIYVKWAPDRIRTQQTTHVCNGESDQGFHSCDACEVLCYSPKQCSLVGVLVVF